MLNTKDTIIKGLMKYIRHDSKCAVNNGCLCTCGLEELKKRIYELYGKEKMNIGTACTINGFTGECIKCSIHKTCLDYNGICKF